MSARRDGSARFFGGEVRNEKWARVRTGNGVVLLFFILLLIFAGGAWYNILKMKGSKNGEAH